MGMGPYVRWPATCRRSSERSVRPEDRLYVLPVYYAGGTAETSMTLRVDLLDEEGRFLADYEDAVDVSVTGGTIGPSMVSNFAGSGSVTAAFVVDVTQGVHTISVSDRGVPVQGRLSITA